MRTVTVPDCRLRLLRVDYIAAFTTRWGFLVTHILVVAAARIRLILYRPLRFTVYVLRLLHWFRLPARSPRLPLPVVTVVALRLRGYVYLVTVNVGLVTRLDSRLRLFGLHGCFPHVYARFGCLVYHYTPHTFTILPRFAVHTLHTVIHFTVTRLHTRWLLSCGWFGSHFTLLHCVSGLHGWLFILGLLRSHTFTHTTVTHAVVRFVARLRLRLVGLHYTVYGCGLRFTVPTHTHTTRFGRTFAVPALFTFACPVGCRTLHTHFTHGYG